MLRYLEDVVQKLLRICYFLKSVEVVKVVSCNYHVDEKKDSFSPSKKIYLNISTSFSIQQASV